MESYPSSSSSSSSDHSKSTAPTIYSDRPLKPYHNYNFLHKYTTAPTYNNPDPRDSRSTYASTVSLNEQDELDESESPEQQQQQQQQQQSTIYNVLDRTTNTIPPEAIPSNQRTFANFFPSSRRLLIRHDDSTIDGNMNLRIDTLVSPQCGFQRDVILFHLRMHDLYARRFSFRRYCRDSGREVCQSVRKPVSSSDRKWGNMLASLRPRSSGDAGCTSGGGGDRSDEHENLSTGRLGDTISLEFSNYAHVELKRRSSPSTRYEYEYWSTRYQWRQRQETRRDADLREVSYYLVNMQTSKSIAHILPEIMTPVEAVEEEAKGGWIPPASMWISDSAAYETMPDIADVIVATGLCVLVDDCIRRRWHSSFFERSLEFGPKRLMDALQRRGSA